MRFAVLGPMQVWRADGTPVRIGGQRLRALLALLLVHPGRVVGVDQLISGVYGQRPPAGVANAVQSQVSRLRRLLDVELVRTPAGYRLEVDPGEVDAHRFEELVAAGLPGQALALWRGPALVDVGDAPFVAAVVARWEELRLRAVEEHGGVGAVPVELLRELVARHPGRERLVAALVRALHRQGRQREALEVFDRARRELAERVGADPSPELAAAHLEVLRGDRPPARQVLPAQLSGFVGREEESRQLAEALGRARLVTVVGPGGVGKTRLAVQVAEAVGGQVAQEVFFVDLVPVGRGEDVARAVLAALGLREDGTGPVTEPAQRVVAALSRGSVLLVLDNCEHVVESVAVLVARLLAGCARVRVLATSREALGVTGEVVRPVPPLGLPEHDGRWSDSPAVRLFAERAAAVRPGFRVADDVASVVAVCRALEGLPLAIELAAARVRSLPVAELARRVHDRFGLLSRGSRGAAARHRTLHAVVEWSWELLDEPERRLARWLTVFRGGATPAAVRAVCGAQAEELLSALADKSLVELAGDRYRMLETIREFCARELVACGESQRAGRAHAEYFLELIGRSGPRLRRAEQVVELGRLAGEHENFRAAARWAARHDPVLALRLVAELGWYFWLRGMRSQGSALAEEVLAAVGPRAPLGAEQEHLLCRLIGVSDGRARVELAGVPERWGAPDFPDPPRYPFLTLLWGMAHGAPQLEGEELEGYRRALVGQDAWSRALVELGAGMQHQYNGLVEQAWQAHRRALAGFRELGERWGASLALSRLADLAAGRGEPRRAVELVGRALALAEELGATEDVAALLGQRACWLERVGACSSARRDLERAAELARRAGSVEALAAAWLGLAELARRRGRSREALRWCREALRVCPSDWFGPAEVRAQARVCLGRLAAARGEVEGARREWAAALDSAVRWGNRVVLAGVAEARAAAEAGPPPSPDSDIDIDSDAGVESESGVEEGVVAGGDARRVAVLLGAAATLRGAADPTDPTDPADPEVRWVLRWARRRLGGDFEALFAQGAGMSREQVLAVLRA